MTWAAVFLAAAGAGLIQSITGFGAAVLMMLVVPYFFDMVRAPALVSAISLGLSVVLAWSFRRQVNLRQVLPIAAIYIVVSTTVISVVSGIDLNMLFIAFGVFLIFLSIYNLFLAKKAAIRPGVGGMLTCGIGAGLGGGLFSTGGPIAAIYFLAAAESKESYIANMQFLFVLTNGANLITRIRYGIYTMDLLPLTIVGILGVMLGKQAGVKVLDRVDIERMKKIVYAFIGISGVLTLVGHL